MAVAFAMVGCADLARAGAFYDAVLAPLGITRHPTLCGPSRLAYWRAGERGLFQVGLPLEGEARFGNGAMTGFEAPDRAAVDAAHRAALAHGGADEGAPGERYPGWHGAYFRDPDGNKAAVFTLTTAGG
jgi:catechol 2,3-dioxygenase-like lactoylglutathione lyase family enzyme